MDADNELARAKWLLASALIFLLSGCFSWGELMYLVSGRTTTADVTRVTETTTGRRFSRRPALMVDFAFTEPNGTRRTGTETVSIDTPVAVGGKTPVQYTAGADGRARLGGHVRWLWVTVFGVSCLLLGVFGFRLWREANEAYKPRQRRPGR